MSKKHHDVRVLTHRAFAVFLTLFLISDVGRVYASRNLEIIAQQGETQPDVTRAEAVKLTEEGLELFNKQGGKESLLAARKKLEAALVLWQKLGDKTFQAATLLGIGRIYSDLGEKQKALQFYNQALPLYREVGHRSGEATTLNNIAVIIAQQRESSPSDATEAEALKLTQEGFQLQKQGSKESLLAARKKYEAALILWQKLEDKTGQVVTLLNIGRIYDDVGEKQKALQFYNQALPILRAVRNTGGEATALNNIGLIYDDLGEKQKALEFYNQALSLSRALEDRRREATTLNNIGSVYSDLGEKQKALEFYEQALPLRREVRDKGGEAATLNNIGRIYSEDLGEKQKALQKFDQALSLYRALADRGGEALTLNNIGSVYDDLGEKQKALQSYNQALPLYRGVADRGGEVITLNNLAYLEHKQGNLQASLKHIESAIAIIEELRGTYTNQDLKTSYFSTVQDYYRGYINILMDLHKKNPSQGYDALALNVSERSRARGLLELLTEARADIRKGANPEILAEESRLQELISAKEKLRFEIVNDKNKSNNPISQAAAQRLEKE
ncbi:MAG: tetratricopeptide repeat protein, partial [Rivularia sp. (in: cyanobacteria)]